MGVPIKEILTHRSHKTKSPTKPKKTQFIAQRNNVYVNANKRNNKKNPINTYHAAVTYT